MTTTLERRHFLKSAALFGGTSAFAAATAFTGREAQAGSLGVDGQYTYSHNDPDNTIYSVCLQCHTSCPIKCKLHRVDDKMAVVAKIDGNPYCPQTLFPNVPYKTRPTDKVFLEELYQRELPVSYIEGRICPKGQAGIQTLYDPYRLRVVLKRDGARGSRKWKTISFDKAIEEIVEGGDLFGEGQVPGLRELYGVQEAQLAAELAADSKAVAAEKMTLDEFKTKHAEHLEKMIDPDHPDLGPKNNLFVFDAGRIEHGRKELMKRFTHDAFGSVNAFEHTTICEQSHHIAFDQCTKPYADSKWGKDANPYDFAKLHPGKLTAFGPPITREKTRLEDTTLFDGQYNARRPWYPFTSNVYQEIIPSAGDAYPYPIGCLFLHKGTPVMACPTGHKQIDILRDPKKIPLFVACDIVIGESTMYADYIIPDLAIWERWGTPHITPAMLTTVSKIRQPVVAPITESVTIDGEEMPISLEAFLIAAAKRLGLSGFGKDAFGPDLNFDRPEDFFIKAAVNIAMGDKLDENGSPTQAAPEADDEELELFRRARRHLPPSVFDEEKWKRATGDPDKYWRRVVATLNRGGNFEDWDKRYKGDKQSHPYTGNFNVYIEPVGTARDSVTGEYYSGLPVVGPVEDAKGNVIEDAEYPLRLITYKDILGGQSRTMAPDPWLSEHIGHADGNHVLMNRRDVRKLGLRNGQLVRVSSATNPDGNYKVNDDDTRDVIGRLEVLEGMRPGVVAISWHCGHWAYGSDDVTIDGELVKGDPTRSRGVLPNPVFREDTSIGNVCLSDPIGGSASFYDTQVRVAPA